jgi:hypothetical protein
MCVACWKIGKIRPLEWRRKMKEIAQEKGFGKWMKGKKISQEVREKIRKTMKGWNGQKYHFTSENPLRYWLGKRGKNTAHWKGGLDFIKNIRNSLEYKLWRDSIFKKDNWTCWHCLKRGGTLCAHHILSFAEFPELRFAINNGITLCKECHKMIHKNNRYKLQQKN